MITAAHCGEVSALTLGLPRTCAVPEAKGTLPTAMFTSHVPISAKLRQRFSGDVRSIAMLALLRPQTIGVTDGTKVHEILVMGVDFSCDDVPTAVLDHIARLRGASKILFVCRCAADGRGATAAGASGNSTSGNPTDSTGDKPYRLAVRYDAPQKNPGHMVGHIDSHTATRSAAGAQISHSCGPWLGAVDAKLTLNGTTLDEVWASLLAQVLLGSTDGSDLDARIAAHVEATALEATIAKLEGDHKRAKTGEKRNEVFAKLQKTRTQLEALRQSL